MPYYDKQKISDFNNGSIDVDDGYDGEVYYNPNSGLQIEISTSKSVIRQRYAVRHDKVEFDLDEGLLNIAFYPETVSSWPRITITDMSMTFSVSCIFFYTSWRIPEKEIEKYILEGIIPFTIIPYFENNEFSSSNLIDYDLSNMIDTFINQIENSISIFSL